MHGPRRLEVVDIKSRQITVHWEPFGYNVTRCHTYNLTVEYRYKVNGKEETREEVCYELQSPSPQHTIRNLSPYTNVSVKLVLRNREGEKESQELDVLTDEDGEDLFNLIMKFSRQLVIICFSGTAALFNYLLLNRDKFKIKFVKD